MADSYHALSCTTALYMAGHPPRHSAPRVVDWAQWAPGTTRAHSTPKRSVT